jgi:hypothetical protein
MKLPARFVLLKKLRGVYDAAMTLTGMKQRVALGEHTNF